MGRMYASVVTWNPFVGCRHACTYCRPSFMRMVKRVYHCQGAKCTGCRDFEPHEHPERLEGPLPTGSTVWPCAHGDIAFADPAFIRRVIARTRDYPGRTFYFQSKAPACFEQYLSDFSQGNTILLTTLETNRDQGYGAVSKAPVPSVRCSDFRRLQWPRKIVTVEPIMDFDVDSFAEMILSVHPEAAWVGYNSKPGSVRLPEPPLEKTERLISVLREAGIEVRPKLLR